MTKNIFPPRSLVLPGNANQRLCLDEIKKQAEPATQPC